MVSGGRADSATMLYSVARALLRQWCSQVATGGSGRWVAAPPRETATLIMSSDPALVMAKGLAHRSANVTDRLPASGWALGGKGHQLILQKKCVKPLGGQSHKSPHPRGNPPATGQPRCLGLRPHEFQYRERLGGIFKHRKQTQRCRGAKGPMRSVRASCRVRQGLLPHGFGQPSMACA